MQDNIVERINQLTKEQAVHSTEIKTHLASLTQELKDNVRYHAERFARIEREHEKHVEDNYRTFREIEKTQVATNESLSLIKADLAKKEGGWNVWTTIIVLVLGALIGFGFQVLSTVT